MLVLQQRKGTPLGRGLGGTPWFMGNLAKIAKTVKYDGH